MEGMAEKELASSAKSKLPSLFGGNKRIPSSSFYAYLFSGIAVDVLAFWLPGAGDIFIAYCRGMYWLNGYKTDKMGMATFIDMAVEAIPFLEALPGATAFVIWSYAINVAETTEAGSSFAGKALSEKAAQMGAEAAAARSIGKGLQGLNGTKPLDGTAPHPTGPNADRNVGYGEKTATAGGAAGAPTTAADKNIGYGNGGPRNASQEKNKNVDGIAPREGRAPQNTGYTPTQPVFRKPANDNERNNNVGYEEAA